jgi:hypothetical protein
MLIVMQEEGLFGPKYAKLMALRNRLTRVPE